MKAAVNTVVTVHYTLTDDAGYVVDRSAEGTPLSYLHGHGNIIPGLEKELDGKETGHKSKLSIPASEAYGEKNPDLIFDAPREQFPPDMKFEVGTKVYADGPNGPVTLTVVKLTEKGAVLDANHPLAGQTLKFDIELIDVRAASDEELNHGHSHAPGQEHH